MSARINFRAPRRIPRRVADDTINRHRWVFAGLLFSEALVALIVWSILDVCH